MSNISQSAVNGCLISLFNRFENGHGADLEIRQRLPKYRFNELAGILGDPDEHLLGRWKSWGPGPYHILGIHKFGMATLIRLMDWLRRNSIKHRFTAEFSI